MEKLVDRLLQPIKHLVVEDCWYSCPLSGECCNENLESECDCGADAVNDERRQAADRITELAAENKELREVTEEFLFRQNINNGMKIRPARTYAQMALNLALVEIRKRASHGKVTLG